MRETCGVTHIRHFLLQIDSSVVPYPRAVSKWWLDCSSQYVMAQINHDNNNNSSSNSSSSNTNNNTVSAPQHHHEAPDANWLAHEGKTQPDRQAASRMFIDGAPDGAAKRDFSNHDGMSSGIYQQHSGDGDMAGSAVNLHPSRHVILMLAALLALFGSNRSIIY